MEASPWRLLHGSAKCESIKCQRPQLVAHEWAYVTRKGGILFCRGCAERDGLGIPPQREGEPSPSVDPRDEMSRFDRQAFRKHLWEKIQAWRKRV